MNTKITTNALDTRERHTCIRRICAEQGIALKDLAERMGKTLPAIYSYMSDDIRISTLKAIAEALGVDPRLLLR